MALDGAALRWPWALPFAGILITIATGPLLFPKIWHRHYGKIAFAWGALTLAPMAALYDLPTALAAFVHALLAEYMSFIVLLFALYVVAGGILVLGNLRGTPLTTRTTSTSCSVTRAHLPTSCAGRRSPPAPPRRAPAA